METFYEIFCSFHEKERVCFKEFSIEGSFFFSYFFPRDGEGGVEFFDSIFKEVSIFAVSDVAIGGKGEVEREV